VVLQINKVLCRVSSLKIKMFNDWWLPEILEVRFLDVRNSLLLQLHQTGAIEEERKNDMVSYLDMRRIRKSRSRDVWKLTGSAPCPWHHLKRRFTYHKHVKNLIKHIHITIWNLKYSWPMLMPRLIIINVCNKMNKKTNITSGILTEI
jgi:hypothetical protein